MSRYGYYDLKYFSIVYEAAYSQIYVFFFSFFKKELKKVELGK